MKKIKDRFNKFNIVGKIVILVLFSPVALLISIPVGFIAVVYILYKSMLKQEYRVNLEGECIYIDEVYLNIESSQRKHKPMIKEYTPLSKETKNRIKKYARDTFIRGYGVGDLHKRATKYLEDKRSEKL